MEDIKSALGLKSEDKDSLFDILRQEHAQIKANLQQILSANRPNTELFAQTIDALNTHMKGEEDYLYPRLEDNPSTRQMAFASYEEHNIAKGLIINMGMATDNDRWMARVRVLYKVLDAHIDAEERQLFPRAKEVLYDQTEREIRSQYTGQRAPPATAR